jgi:hypothetical protein
MNQNVTSLLENVTEPENAAEGHSLGLNHVLKQPLQHDFNAITTHTGTVRFLLCSLFLDNTLH